jgi:predicted enzyme related to lactoylglutathione lyase
VADPQGAMFVLFQPANPDSAPTPPTPGTPGHVGWHELHAAEWQPAFTFYSARFGWTDDGAVDMGPMGTYQLFAIDGRQSGGMMTKMDAFPAPVWIYYFTVAGIEAAAMRVKAAGGQVLNGPHQVPGGSWIAQCLDPQGAMFAIVGSAS